VGGLLVAGLVSTTSAHAQYYPIRVDSSSLDSAPYRSTGLVFAENYRGSAAVARDSRLLYTCAHLLYGDGIWATDVAFARGWHSSVSPTSSQMIGVRGYRYYATYGGTNSATDFSLDFAIGYRTATTSFGTALGYYEDGGAALRSSSIKKLVLGYPAKRDYDGAAGYYYQHRTGPFTGSMRQVSGSYHTISGVTTGGGNSGGPVLAYESGTYSLAGILVSGSTNSMGVHGLDDAASTMAKNALAYLNTTTTPGVSKTVSNTSSLRLTDGSTSYSSRSLTVSGLPVSTTAASFTLRIETTYRGDLDVYLRSPAGRVQWVKKHSPSDASANLSVNDASYTSTFAGANPNGTWQVYMRDYYQGDRATFKTASLKVTSY
jgi:subtilisin-like proprotein convertase family protein